MSDSELTTDAMPSPPRDQENSPKKSYQENPRRTSDQGKEKLSESDEEKEDINGQQSKNYPPPPPPPPQNQATFIQVNNATGVHIGNNITYNSSKTQEQSPKIKETKQIKSLKNSTEPVTSKDIDVVSTHMNAGWKETARALEYTDGQLDNFVYMHPNNFKEIKYSFLRDWIENKGPKCATVGLLAGTMWNTEQREAVKVWAEKYDEIHDRP